MSGIKIVLRVPKETDNVELEDEESSNEHDESNDFDAENSNSCTGGASSSAADDNSLLCTFASITESSANSTPIASASTESPSTSVRKRKRKRRFMFTMPAQKSARFKRKIDEECGIEKDKRKNATEGAQVESDATATASDSPAAAEPFSKTVEISPLHKLLDHMLKYLEKKDPNQYFMLPVSHDVDPNYCQVIREPMDFSTMRHKLDSGSYVNLPQFKADVELICKNAVQYNEPGTVLRIATEKLKALADYLFSKDRLVYMLKTEPYVSKITASELGCELYKSRQLGVGPGSKVNSKRYACIVDDMDADDVLFQASSAAMDAKARLAARKPNCKAAYVNTSEDGTLTLRLVAPENVQGGGCADGKVYTLAHLVPNLKEGTPGLTKQDVKPTGMAIPYTALDYGNFSSFAPFFDSTWSSLSKEESDLLLSTFDNNQKSVDYVDSVRRFVRGSGDELIHIVDNLLDSLTGGEYKKRLKIDNQEYVDVYDDSLKTNFIGATSRTDGTFQTDQSADRLQTADDILAKNSSLLGDLQKAQYDRLSKPPPLTLTESEGPSVQEMQVAEQLLAGLQALASQAEPGHLVSTKTVRSFMGVSDVKPLESTESNGSEEYDMEVFKEFFEV